MAIDSPQLGSVLITTPSFGQHSHEPWQALTEQRLVARRPRAQPPLDARQLADEIGEADALIIGLDKVDASVLDAAPRLKAVAKHGVGVDNIDCDAAQQRGIRVLNAPGSNTGAVADLTMAVLLAAVRKVVSAHTSVIDGQWGRFFGPELGGKTLGVLGFGKIGQAVARRAHGFDMRIVAYDPYLPETVFAEQGVESADLDECVTSSDILTLHMPMAADSEALLNRERLGRMRQGACVVNTARGGLVDEAALAELLREGHLGAAAVDVFSAEPPRDSPLLHAPNVVVTPHIGAYSYQANATMGATVVHDIARVLRGEEPLHRVV
jgi:D-3-phosphoglycerate dehydrogenase